MTDKIWEPETHVNSMKELKVKMMKELGWDEKSWNEWAFKILEINEDKNFAEEAIYPKKKSFLKRLLFS